MNFNVIVKDGVIAVTDAATGKPIDWIETVDLVLAPPGTPILYLGTTNFTASFGVGPAAVPASGAPPAP